MTAKMQYPISISKEINLDIYQEKRGYGLRVAVNIF